MPASTTAITNKVVITVYNEENMSVTGAINFNIILNTAKDLHT
jgi:hypothetical protein